MFFSSANDDQARVEDLQQQLVELRDSYNQLEQESTVGRQILERELGETNQALNDAKWRYSILFFVFISISLRLLIE